jgi:uncharacterized protein (TIGR02996 family)
MAKARSLKAPPRIIAPNQALHDAVLASPDDDAPRLVYADWLMQQGDPRGEFIAVQIEQARLESEDPRQAELRARELDLLAVLGKDWRARYGPLDWSTERGFVSSLRGRQTDFDAYLDPALVDSCVRHLSLWFETDALAYVSRALSRIALRSLALSGLIDVSALELLCRVPAFQRLEWLHVPISQITARHLAALKNLPRLDRLGLTEGPVGDELSALATWDHSPVALRFEQVGLAPGALERFAYSRGGSRLNWLRLKRCRVDERDLLAIVAAQSPLIGLELPHTRVGPALAHAVANAPHLAKLQLLDLSWARIGTEGVGALVASPYLSRELDLYLDGEALGFEWEETFDQGGYSGCWIGSPPESVTGRFKNLEFDNGFVS